MGEPRFAGRTGGIAGGPGQAARESQAALRANPQRRTLLGDSTAAAVNPHSFGPAVRTVLKRLFRLLLRLVQLSERFVPQCAMLRRQLLLLRDRILTHRTQDTRIEEIGTLLAAGRFEEAARLINLASSVQWLFQAADAVAGQLETGPTSLSKVFEAIEDACPEPSVKVRVFYAGVLTALGRYLAAGDTLMAARTGAPASLLESLDLEARALRPMQITGRQPNLEGKRTIVILDLDADLRLVSEWLERYPDSQIVAENEDAFSYLGPSAARLTTFSSMMDSNSSVLSAALKDVVDAFSEEFTSALARTFRDSPSARSFFAVQRLALKASMRKRLIKPVLRTLMIRTVLEQTRRRTDRRVGGIDVISGAFRNLSQAGITVLAHRIHGQHTRSASANRDSHRA